MLKILLPNANDWIELQEIESVKHIYKFANAYGHEFSNNMVKLESDSPTVQGLIDEYLPQTKNLTRFVFCAFALDAEEDGIDTPMYNAFVDALKLTCLEEPQENNTESTLKMLLPEATNWVNIPDIECLNLADVVASVYSNVPYNAQTVKIKSSHERVQDLISEMQPQVKTFYRAFFVGILKINSAVDSGLDIMPNGETIDAEIKSLRTFLGK